MTRRPPGGIVSEDATFPLTPSLMLTPTVNEIARLSSHRSERLVVTVSLASRTWPASEPPRSLTAPLGITAIREAA
jgi:hypothetical protein